MSPLDSTRHHNGHFVQIPIGSLKNICLGIYILFGFYPQQKKKKKKCD